MKVVSAKEMSRIEALSFSKGFSDEEFMEKVGKNIAYECQAFLSKNTLIYLLLGKGNNAGDALVLGRFLLKMGFSVFAISFFDIACYSKLAKKNTANFLREGGSFQDFSSIDLKNKSIVFFDGIFGTGFQGKIDGDLKEKINIINGLKLPIFAIDIPSGLNATTGKVESVAINASHTFFLELPKIGFFINDGPKHTGKLYPISFGLPNEFIDEAHSDFEWLTESFIVHDLPPINRLAHKYQKGFVVGLSGSLEMPGAAYLSSYAALRAGSGIVKVFLPSHPLRESFSLRPEIIQEGYGDSFEEVLKLPFQTAGAGYIGPGLGTLEGTKKVVKHVLQSATIPLVIDADALNIISCDKTITIPPFSILTPHIGEMQRLLFGSKYEGLSLDFLGKCQEFAVKHQICLILKGMPTFIFFFDRKPLICTRGDPGMATAGSGDVLSGILASLLSQKLSLHKAAPLAVLLHCLAGEIAAEEKTSRSCIASDIIEAIPKAYKRLEDIKNY